MFEKKKKEKINYFQSELPLWSVPNMSRDKQLLKLNTSADKNGTRIFWWRGPKTSMESSIMLNVFL